LLAEHKQFVVAYDNFNFQDTVRDQIIGSSKPLMRNLTTAIMVANPSLPLGGLWQRSLSYAERPLHFMDVLTSSGMRDDSTARAIARHFVAEAIRYQHPAAVRRVLAGIDQYPMPTLDVLPPNRTPVHLLSAMFENEASIEGTARVHAELFLKQLRLGRSGAGSGDTDTDEAYLGTALEFTERLFLAYGDQLTAARIRSVKLGQRDARRAFDQRSWLLGPPAFFHVAQALLLLLVRTHWEPDKNQYSKHTLVHDVVYLNRHGINKGSVKYHQLQPLLTQGFRARVTALFYRSMRRAGVFGRAVEGSNGSREYAREWDDVEAAVQSLSAEDFERHVDAVCNIALSREAWMGEGVENHDFVSMCRYLQEVMLFLQLQHAVKFGDIGLLARLIDPLAVVFLGSGQSNYGYEMLHLRWILHHADPELRRAILAGGLVNERGKVNSFKAIDLVLEHINLGFACDIKKVKNSTHDVTSTFIRGSLVHDELRLVRAAFELNFGSRTNTMHTYKSAVKDVFHLAVHLDAEQCTVPMVTRSASLERQFLSTDVFDIGVRRLPTKVERVNSDMSRLSRRLADRARVVVVDGDNAEGDGDQEPDSEVSNAVRDVVESVEQEFFVTTDYGNILDAQLVESRE
jgi:hypothetical protein